MSDNVTPAPTRSLRRKPRRLTSELVEILSESIRNHSLRPGDKLPTESEIMIQQGVSRTVVREALSGLQAAGLVETRHGVGTFVLEAPKSLDLRVESDSILAVWDVMAMLELRISLESEAARLAAARRSEGQMAGLRRVLDAFQEALRDGRETVEQDFQFHLLVAQATGNRYFVDVLTRFGTATIPRTRVRLFEQPGDQTLYLTGIGSEHEQIYNSILRSDPEGAGMFMRAHLSNSRERFQRAVEPERPSDPATL